MKGAKYLRCRYETNGKFCVAKFPFFVYLRLHFKDFLLEVISLKITKEHSSSIWLFIITVWAALQFIFLQNIPDTVSTFSFVFITNIIGVVFLSAARTKKIKLINKKLILKGFLLSAELIGFNFFMIIGSKGMDSVSASSVASMYFVFVTPLLLIMRKRVSFRSAIGSVMAVIALLLLFNADSELLLSSPNTGYLIIADIFFAAYVVTLSVIGKNEDSSALTISQMIFSCIMSLIGWCIEVGVGVGKFEYPADIKFWISVIFFGIFIRALYGLIQTHCQKFVKPVNASLIYSSEILITLIANPFIAPLMNTAYTPVSNYQIAGGVLFVIALLITDDSVMKFLGYSDMDVKVFVDENGKEHIQSTVSKKLTNMTLIISMTALVVSTVICIGAISSIKTTAVDNSISLGQEAADGSEKALRSELEKEITAAATDKAMLADAKLKTYVASAHFAAGQAAALYSSPEDYKEREVFYPVAENAGKWAMQRSLADRSVSYDSVEAEDKLLGNLEGVFDSIIKHNDNIAAIYIGTETGINISYDPNSENADLGVENYYDYRESDWYKGSRATTEPFFTKAYQDSYGRGLTITCACPVYDNSRRFRGCIGIDILINDLNMSMVNDNILDPNYAALIDSEGYIIASVDIGEATSCTVSIFDDEAASPIKNVADTVLSGTSGITVSADDDDAVYISYARIPLTDWVFCLMSPVADIIKPAVIIRDNIDSSTEQVTGTVNESIRVIIRNCLVFFAVIILIITYFVGRFAAKIADPLKNLESDVLEISNGNFEQRTNVDTDDEIGSLARAFNFMTGSLQKYIEDLKDVTAREQRIASELSVAAKIQADMLPSTFPAFPERNEFDIYAAMTPAKEVGGDFYDFFLIDDDHLALVMADVSGKGVPAALFMVIAKTLIKNRAMMGGTPSEILHDVNNQLCEGNKEEMFVTAWLCIIEISSGRCTASNAGHEYPAIRRADGKYELYKQKHSMALAVMEDVRFRQYEFGLSAGDSIYVYTDGVAEATNSQNELFGTDRMLDALNTDPSSSPEQLLEAVHKGIDDFILDAPQFDDITMLCLHYYGKDGNRNG